MVIFSAALATFGLGFLYFVSAIPGGMAMGLPWWGAAICAGIGYSAGSLIVILFGGSFRQWLMKKFSVEDFLTRNKGPFWRAWNRFGLVGMCLLGPVTVGPQIGSLIGLSLVVPVVRLYVGLTLGAIPWCLGFGVVSAFGKHWIHF